MQHIAPTESSSVGVAHKHCASCHRQFWCEPWRPNSPFAEIHKWNAATCKKRSQSVCSTSISIPQLSCYNNCVLRAILPASEMATKEFYTRRRWMVKNLILDDAFLKNLNYLKKKSWEHSNTENKQKGLKCITKSVCFEKRFHAGSTKAHSTAGWLPAGMCSCLQFLSKKAMIKTNNMYIYILIIFINIIQPIKHKTDKCSKRHGLHGFTDLL